VSDGRSTHLEVAMRPAIGLLAISLFTVHAVHANPDPKQAPPPPPGPKIDALSEKAALLAPIQIDSLTLTPIVATSAPVGKEIDVLTLDEAMPAKQVRIQEIASESVNNLTMINSSDKPVFVLAGEVILGGKQDRIIGANTVIPAKTTQTVPVFCVEHGRWDNSSKEFTTAKALAHGRLRGKANYAAQGEVWQEVAAKNELRKTKSSSDTYRHVAVQQSDGTLKTWQKRVDDALAKVTPADRARMIGYVIALNGKVATVDMFQSPALFKKLEGKLVKSYVTEAVDIATAKDVKPPTAKDVQEFMFDADKAAEEQAYETKASSAKMYKGSHAQKAKVQLKSAPDLAPAADAPSVYENYQAK
jgi:hypothetical protein